MAKLAGERTIEESKIEQRVNLSNYFDGELSEGQKIRIGQELVDTIVERSENQKDVNGKRFPAYSTSYKKSEDFDRFGKSASDRNMTLKGNMLEGVDFEISGNEIVLKMQEDQTAKAHGNITGQNGKWTNGKKKVTRDFFGVTESEVKKVARENPAPQEPSLAESSLLSQITLSQQSNTTRALFDRLFTSLLRNADGEG